MCTNLSPRVPRRKKNRTGAVLPFAAFLMVAMLGMVALALDLGYLMVARTELQRSADAAAISAAWQLIDEQALEGDSAKYLAFANARQTAVRYAGHNAVCNATLAVDANFDNAPDGDVLVGYLANPFDRDAAMLFNDISRFNAVQVTVDRSGRRNDLVPVFFARIFGLRGVAAQAQATAALLTQIGGFRAPRDGKTLPILPIALDLGTWERLLDGDGDDRWSWQDDGLRAGSDHIKEVNLYPQDSGAPGNRGTVDIGSNNNSTADLARQITDGVSRADLEYHGGTLEFDSSGKLRLNGDPGISAGIKDELASIIGDPRVIPIFESVTGPGNNAQYTIVKWAGVRVLDVRLTGSSNSKRVIVQPANLVVDGAIRRTDGNTSDFVYTRPVLVR